MARKADSSAITARDRIFGLLLALPFLAAGVYPIAIGLHWIPFDPGKLHAPEWVMVVIGLVFLSAGVAIAVMVLRPKSNPLKMAMVVWVLGLAAVAHWVAFGEGGREFFHSRQRAGVLVDMGPIPEAEGRRMFGIGAVALDAGIALMAVLAVRKRVVKSRAGARPRP